TPSSTSKRVRETSANKGKGKEGADESFRASKRARRATYPATAALTINEPSKTSRQEACNPEGHSTTTTPVHHHPHQTNDSGRVQRILTSIKD
ncbi:hypothetical protein A0H81_06386, partial [Grifola frondosa]